MEYVYLVGFNGYDYPHLDTRAICTTEEEANKIANELNDPFDIMPWNRVSVVGPLKLNTNLSPMD